MSEPGAGHNSNALREQLRAYVGQIEGTEAEIAALNTDKSETYKSAKEAGIDVKALRAVIAYRRKKAKQGVGQIEAEDAKFTEYLGLVESGTDVATRARTEAAPKRIVTADVRREPVPDIDIEIPEILRRTA